MCRKMLIESCPKMGIVVEDPEFIQVGHHLAMKKEGVGYVEHCDKFPFDNYRFVVVILTEPGYKKKIKAFLDGEGIASQFILGSTIDRARDSFTVYTNILRQINAKMR